MHGAEDTGCYSPPPVPQPFGQLPSSLAAMSRTVRLAGGHVPALLVHPHLDATTGRAARPAPILVWMHGRTVTKELDPGRYLRLARAGIASCALDLPGHGERFDAALQDPATYQDGVRAAALNAEYEQARRDLDAATEAWMSLVDGA
jgi:hypothetical protein